MSVSASVAVVALLEARVDEQRHSMRRWSNRVGIPDTHGKLPSTVWRRRQSLKVRANEPETGIFSSAAPAQSSEAIAVAEGVRGVALLHVATNEVVTGSAPADNSRGTQRARQSAPFKSHCSTASTMLATTAGCNPRQELAAAVAVDCECRRHRIRCRRGQRTSAPQVTSTEHLAGARGICVAELHVGCNVSSLPVELQCAGCTSPPAPPAGHAREE